MAVAALAALVSVASAGEAECSHGKGGAKGDGHQQMWKQMGLTEQQRESLKALRLEQTTEVKEIGQKLRAVRKTVKEELLKDDPSSSVLDRAAADAGDLTEKLTESFVDHLLEVKKILTPEQFAKLLQRENMLQMGAMAHQKACGPQKPAMGCGKAKDDCCPKAKGGGCPKAKKGECPHKDKEGTQDE
jgi:Spy/CpxP family protein refolding chaperone